jgi:aminoglycoside phosphotransferase (APT) family kinase protein
VTGQRVVEELLARDVVSIAARPSDFEKRTPVEVLSATLAGGERVELFVKHLGFQVHPHGQVDREQRVYLELFAANALPVPRCYGAAQGVLVLEHVHGSPLHHHGLDQWLAAARDLATLHMHFVARRDELLAAEFLLRIDADYLMAWAERAIAGVSDSYPAELATRVERLAASWERVTDLIASQPVTLVHNHLSSKNVIVSGTRICFVDWEMAGVGCALQDLVHLRYQRLDPMPDRTVLDEYVGGLAGNGLLPAKPRELRAVLAACELQRIVYKLGRSGTSGRTVEQVAHRVERAERLWSEL